jgi:hypothetical protein
MCQFPLSANNGNLLPLQITEPVSGGKYGKNISYECEWTFRYQFFAAEALGISISHIFWLKGNCPANSKMGQYEAQRTRLVNWTPARFLFAF